VFFFAPGIPELFLAPTTSLKVKCQPYTPLSDESRSQRSIPDPDGAAEETGQREQWRRLEEREGLNKRWKTSQSKSRGTI
jgi:hypothetical protein